MVLTELRERHKPKQREVLGGHLPGPVHPGYPGRLKVGLLVHKARAQIIDASPEVRHTLDHMDPPGLLWLVWLGRNKVILKVYFYPSLGLKKNETAISPGV